MVRERNVGRQHREDHRLGQRHKQVTSPRRTRKNIGRNTMQMHSVETSAGTAICARAIEDGLLVVSLAPLQDSASMFSISTVASSTRMPTASARPPSVMMLIVSPEQAQARSPTTKIDRGIEIAMMIVERQLPRNSRIINAVRRGRDDRLAHHAPRPPRAQRQTDPLSGRHLPGSAAPISSYPGQHRADRRSPRRGRGGRCRTFQNHRDQHRPGARPGARHWSAGRRAIRLPWLRRAGTRSRR